MKPSDFLLKAASFPAEASDHQNLTFDERRRQQGQGDGTVPFDSALAKLRKASFIENAACCMLNK